jgi:hypothetical protein
MLLSLPPSPLSFHDDITNTRFAYVVIPAVVYKAVKWFRCPLKSRTVDHRSMIICLCMIDMAIHHHQWLLRLSTMLESDRPALFVVRRQETCRSWDACRFRVRLVIHMWIIHFIFLYSLVKKKHIFPPPLGLSRLGFHIEFKQWIIGSGIDLIGKFLDSCAVHEPTAFPPPVKSIG